MLDLEYETVGFEERVKKRMFKLQRELMRSKVELPLILMLIIVVVEFYLISGVFFVQNPLSIGILNQGNYSTNSVFRYPLLMNIELTLGLTLRTIVIILLAIEALGLGAFFIMWANSDKKQHSNSTVRKITTVIFGLYHYCIVIFTYFVIQIDKIMLSGSMVDSQLSGTLDANYTSEPFEDDPVNTVLILLLNITNVSMLVLILPIIYLTINPLRKCNKSWNYNNRYDFISFILNLTRALIVAIDSLSITFILLSFICHIFLYLDTEKHPPFTIEMRLLRNFKNHLLSALHISIFIFLATNNQKLSFQLLIVLFVFVLVKVCLEFNNYAKQEIYFPLCNQKVQQFYNFYFIFQEKSQSINIQNSKSSGRKLSMQQVFQIHLTNCASRDCIFNHCHRQRLDDLEFSRKLITVTLDNKKNESPQNYILNELWLLEIGTKTSVTIQEKVKILSIQQQYIVQLAKNSIKNIQINRNESIIKTQTLQTQSFYAKIDQTLESFSRFYAEVEKPSPEFETLIESGYSCKMNTLDLKTVYNQNLKSKSMTFKMLEVYIEFQVHFGLSQQTSAMNWMDKGEQLQKNQGSSALQELYLPTIFVNTTSGLIQSSNLSACNFLKLTRYELKLKPIADIFDTQVTIEDLTSMLNKKSKNEKHSRAKCILKKGNHELICVRIKIADKTVENHSVLVISFQEEKLFHNKNVYLADEKGEMLTSIRKETSFKTGPGIMKVANGNDNGNRKILDWEEVFEMLIQPEWDKLKSNKIIKLHGNQTFILNGLLLIVNLENSISSGDYIVTVTGIVDSTPSENRLSVRNSAIDRSSDIFNKKKSTVFKFYYHEDIQNDPSSSLQTNIDKEGTGDSVVEMDKKEILNSLREHQLSIIGINVDLTNHKHQEFLSTSKNFSTGFLFRHLSQMMVKKTILNQAPLSRGIKTYRLWDKNLYNIDLEDKQAYVKSIEQNSSFDEKNFQKNKKNQNITIYLFAVIVLLVVGLSISVYFLFNQSINDFQTILVSYRKHLIMQSIYMSYNKINGIFRDAQSGLYQKLNQDWRYDVFQSTNSIKNKRMLDLDLFTSKNLQAVYQNITYQGNFNELFDIFLSEVTSMVYLGDSNVTKILALQNFSQEYLYGYFTAERQYHFSIMLSMSSTVEQNLSDSFYISLVLVVLIGVLQLKLFYTVMQKLKEKLNYILLTSDYEAKLKFQNSEKIRYMIDMIQKNFQIDIHNLLKEKNHFQKRKKSKNPKYNTTKKLFRTFAIIIYFAIHITYVNICESIVSQNIQNCSEMFNMVRNLMRCYTRVVHISTLEAYTGKISASQLLEAKQSLQYIDEHRRNSAFGAQTDKMIEDYMYSNLCLNQAVSAILFAGENVACEKATPTFIIENPMQLGVLQYIRRIQYQLVDNVTETFAVSGVFATPFARLFNLLATQFLVAGESNINQYIDTLILQNQSLIILSVVYIFLGAYFLWLQVSLSKQIKVVTDFFKSGQEMRILNEIYRKKMLQKQSANLYKKSVGSKTSIAFPAEQSTLVDRVKQRKRTNNDPSQEESSENSLTLDN